MKKLLLGILWCVVLYFGACMVTGGIAGGIAGSHSRNAAMASQAGRQAGAKAVNDNRGYLVAGAIVLSAIGSGLGVLPGTRGS